MATEGEQYFKWLTSQRKMVQESATPILQGLAEDGAHLLLVGFYGPPAPRTGVRLFFSKCEYMLYDPKIAERERLFTFSVVLWEDSVWAVGAFPLRDSKKLARIARTCDLRFANGIPQSFPLSPRLPIDKARGFGAARTKIHPHARIFPINSARVFTLEFKEGHRLTKEQENDQLAMWHGRR